MWISDDGHWWWNGAAWVARGANPQWPAVPLSFGEAISLPTRDRDWLRTIAVEGLIGLIPIVGWFQLVGWMMAYLDNLRAGSDLLPVAGLTYAKRGWRVALVGLVYGVGLGALFYAGFFSIVWLLIGTSQARGSQPGGAAPFPGYFFAGFLAFQAVVLLVFALLHLVIAPVILRTDRLRF